MKLNNFINGIGAFVVLMAMAASASCYTQRKAQKQVVKAQTHYPSLVANDCLLWYPIKSSTNTITKIVQGETQTDTITCIEQKLDTLLITKHITHFRTDTIAIKVTDTVESTSALFAATAENDILKSELSKQKEKEGKIIGEKNIYRNICLWILIALLVYLGIKYIKKSVI
jgi:hypothetical protein